MKSEYFIKSQCTLSNKQRVCRHHVSVRQDTASWLSRRSPQKYITHNRHDTVSTERRKVNKSVDLYSFILTC